MNGNGVRHRCHSVLEPVLEPVLIRGGPGPPVRSPVVHHGRARLLVAGLVAAVVGAWAPGAAAHGAGALGGLPLERWQYTWGCVAIVLITFVVVGSSWRRPVLAAASEGRPLPAAAQTIARGLGWVARLVGVVAYVVIVTAGLFGSAFPAANIAPIGVFITLWIGVALVSLVLGDVWRALSPFDSVAAAAAWVRARVTGRGAPTGAAPEPPAGASHLPAATLAFGFVWLELAYHSATTPLLLGWLGLLYGAVLWAGAARWGRGWLRTADVFAVVFGLFAALAPLHRGDDGAVRARWPLTGLGRLPVRDGTLAVLVVLIGANVFDGWTRTTFWLDLTFARVGWGYTTVATLGLIWTMGIVALVYLGATRLAAALAGVDGDDLARSLTPMLVPLAAAYTVAHSFAILVIEGQGFWFLVSNPYGWGWDLFGTDAGTVDADLVSTGTIVWVQAAAIALGHAMAVAVAHDRTLTDLEPRPALGVRYVMLGLVVGSTIAAVALLVGN